MSAEDGPWRGTPPSFRQVREPESQSTDGPLPRAGRSAPMICGIGTETGAEALDDLLALISGPLAALAAETGGGRPLGLGLRLSARALETLSDQTQREILRRRLGEAGIVAVSANGFAPGPLLPGRVKERIFVPDWREEERLHYTTALGELIAELGPIGHPVSVTTVPGADRTCGRDDGTLADIADGMLRAAAHFADIERRTGRRVVLALHPVPGALLETAEETAEFVARWLFSSGAARRFAALADLSPARAADGLPGHFGVCLDTATMAVTGEKPAEALAALRRVGIPVAKLVVGCVVRFDPADEAARTALTSLGLDRHLHPVIGRNAAGDPVRHADLAQALAETAANGVEAGGLWRAFRRVGLSRAPGRGLEPTVDVADAALALHVRAPFAPEIEVEGLLPADDARYLAELLGDMAWVRARLGPGA